MTSPKMRLFILSFLGFCLLGPVFARQGFIVPFANVALNPNNQIVASYTFGPHKIIFCYDNTLQTEGNIIWNFQGQAFSAPLPIFLKTAANYQGSFADPVGNVLITNTTAKTLIISCEFGF